MKVLKSASITIALVGLAAAIAVIIWYNVDPNLYGWPVDFLTLIGFYSLPVGLLGLIIFYVLRFIKRGKTKKPGTPAFEALKEAVNEKINYC